MLLDIANDNQWAEDYQLRLFMKKALEAKAAGRILEELGRTEPAVKATEGDAVDAYFRDRLATASARLQGTTRELEKRIELSDSFVREIDYQIATAATSLDQFRSFGVGYNRGVDMKRTHLERQLADFRHKRRQEELRLWQDLVSMRQSVRDAQVQYRDALRQWGLAGYGGGADGR
jgi:predicted metal-dependent hydrolase